MGTDFPKQDDPFALTKYEKRQIQLNSIERVINSAIGTAENLLDECKNDDARELADTNLRDLQELKRVVCKLWDRERNTIFLEAQKAQEQRDMTHG